MTVVYTKEKLYRTGDRTGLTFASFFNLMDEFVRSDAIRLGRKNRIDNRLALYLKKESDVIVIYTMRTTSDDDDTNTGKCISDLLNRESDYDYYVGVNNISIKGGTSEDEGKIYPGIQLYGQDHRSEDIQHEKTKRKIYKIIFGQPQMNMVELEWLHEVQFQNNSTQNESKGQ
jgi:hypothetical protein